jgi:DNA polymerase-1
MSPATPPAAKRPRAARPAGRPAGRPEVAPARKAGAKPRLFLIDGYSNIFRAYYAIRNLSSSKGEPTNAVFGFLQMLRKLLRDEQPEFLGVAFDVSSATHRKERFEDYKANRRPMPDDLRPQIAWIREVIAAFRIPVLELEKYEADDVLGTLACKGAAEGYEVILVSPDKDLMQLVGDGVSIFHTGREKLYDAAGVEEDFGVPPSQVVDVLALMGDASDNVPGVPGIGEKGAKQLIKDYGSLDALLERAGELTRKAYREGLTEHRDKALLSRELVTIHCDLPIPLEPEHLRLDEPDWDRLREICQQLDFHVIAKELEAQRPAPPASALLAARDVEDAAEWRELTAGLRGDIAVGLVGDARTGQLRPLGLVMARPIAGAAEGEDSVAAVYADFRRDGLEAAATETLRGWVADEEVCLVGHDLKELLRVLPPRTEPRCRLFDTMLVSYLTRSALRNHDFAGVALDRLGVTPMSAQDAGVGREGDPLPGDPALLRHAAEQALLPWRMLPEMRRDLAAAALTAVYHQIEEPLLPVLATMEEKGILLDCDYLQQMSRELEKEIGQVEQEIYQLAGETFNIASPQQLGFILFEKLQFPSSGKTRKTKQYATDADVLEGLASIGHALPQRLLRYREMTKLKSTYVDALPSLCVGDGRVHTRFNQAVAATGRLSSAHPNLQNIPVRTELGLRIRKGFRAEPGARLVVADYSQIELRVLAHMAEEQVMIDAFARGEDIHAATAAAVFGGSSLLVSSEQRRIAKVINFGIVYGMSPFGLAQRLGIGRKEAEEFITRYLEQYPGVRRYTDATLEEALSTGEVKTLFGRVRQIPDIHSRNWNLREGGRRMAINAPIQGTAADLLKLAMIAVDRRLRRELPAAHLLLTVHDELVLEAPEADVEALRELVRHEMASVAELKVPLVVDVGDGPTWFDAKH